MRLGLITGIAGALLLAGCGGDEEVQVQSPLETQQSLTVLTFFDEAMEPMLHFGWSVDHGWHFSVARQQIDVVSRFSSDDAVSIGDAFSEFGDEASGGGGRARFSASAVVVSGFRADAMAASGFSTSTDAAGGFSTSTGASSGFSAGLSAGSISCDLSGLCGLVGAICTFADGIDDAFAGGTGGGSAGASCEPAVNECVAQISAAVIPAPLAPVICVMSEFFGCVGDAIANATNPESFGADIESVCSSELMRLQQVGLEAFASFGEGPADSAPNSGSP